MPEITIEQVAFDTLVTEDQVLTIEHKLAAAPDSTFVVDTTSAPVGANGVLDPAFVISGLAYETYYTVRISNTCGGDGVVAYRTFLTGENPCPDVERIYGFLT